MKFKSKTPRTKSSKKWDSSYNKPLGIIVALGLAFFLLKDFFGGLFSAELSEEEKSKLAAIKAIPVNFNNTTISVAEARQRAVNLHAAMDGAGTDEVEIVKQLIKAQFQSQLSSFSAVSTTSGTVWTTILFGAAGYVYDWYTAEQVQATYKSKYKMYENDIKLTDDDLNLIAREFGVKSGTNFSAGMVGYYTLSEWVQSETSGGMKSLIDYIFRNSDVAI